MPKILKRGKEEHIFAVVYKGCPQDTCGTQLIF